MHPRLTILLLSAAALIVAGCTPKEKPEKLTIAPLPIAEFSSTKALAHVQAQVDFGPRPAGSAALAKCREYVSAQLKSFGWEVQEQKFKQYTPKGEIEFVNVRARFPIAGSDTWNRPCAVLLGSHYDTKLFNSFEFVGANDAGSSTGVLLEMGRVFAKQPDSAQFVELVCFDGEEAMVNYTMDRASQLPDDGLFGSRYYVSQMRKLPSIQWPLFMVLLDMVGDRDLKIEMPTNTTPLLRNVVMESAEELKYEKYFTEGSKDILDDHYPFLISGIKAVDIIDLNYPAWHTSSDRMDQISEESLGIVGKTTLLAIQKLLTSHQ